MSYAKCSNVQFSLSVQKIRAIYCRVFKMTIQLKTSIRFHHTDDGSTLYVQHIQTRPYCVPLCLLVYKENQQKSPS